MTLTEKRLRRCLLLPRDSRMRWSLGVPPSSRFFWEATTWGRCCLGLQPNLQAEAGAARRRKDFDKAKRRLLLWGDLHGGLRSRWSELQGERELHSMRSAGECLRQKDRRSAETRLRQSLYCPSQWRPLYALLALVA